MGQYYKPAVITTDNRIMTMSSYDFGGGAKLTEHSWIGNEFVNTVFSLIWNAPKQVAWLGDYSKDPYGDGTESSPEFPYTEKIPFEQFEPLYVAVWEKENDIPKKLFTPRDFSILDFSSKGVFLVNHSRQCFINLENYISECTECDGDWDGCMNPLPLLTACGNNQGGGDFYSESIGFENIGIWAFDMLEYTKTVPKEYIEAHFQFFDHK